MKLWVPHIAEEFFEMLLKYQLLKNDSVPWSLLVENERTLSCVIT
jgi:hypothetical protein